MTVQNPPVWLHAGSHSAEAVRRLTASLTGDTAGVVVASDLAVTQDGTPSMNVRVAAGRAFITGSESANQGTYFVESRSTETLAIAASDPTNGRIDLVVAKVQDTAYSGVVDAWSLAVVTGTPAGSPVAPSAPDNSIVLAQVAVAAAATTITNANITDLRPMVSAAWGASWGALGVAQASSSTSSIGGTTVDVTGLTATTDPLPAGRYVRVSVVGNVSSTVGADVVAFSITDGSNTVKNRFDSGELAGATRAFAHSWVEQTAGGAITRKLRAQRVVGSGSCQVYADATRKAQIVIEDLGPVRT